MRIGYLFLLIIGLGGGLGACSTAMEYTSALGDSEVTQLKEDVTPEQERSALMKSLGLIQQNHHRDAVREIEAR